MRLRRLILHGIMMMALGLSNFANSDDLNAEYIYKIKPGDDLGSLLYSMGFAPLWGNSGYVQKVIELNQVIVRENGDLMFPSEKLILPSRPHFWCNVAFSQNNVRIMTKIKTSDEYKNLVDKLPSNCKEGNQDQILSYNKPKPTQVREISSEVDSAPSNIKDIPEFKRFGRIIIIPRISFSKIKGSELSGGPKGEVFSNANYGFKFAWEQIWSSSFESNYFVDVEKQSYQQNPNRTLSNDAITLVNVGVNAKHRFSENTSLNSQFAFGEEIFLNAPNASTLILDKASTAKAKVGIGFNLADLSPFKFEAEIGGQGVLATEVKDYKSKNGIGYYATLMMTQKYKDKKILGAVGYDYIEKNTTRLKQDHVNLKFHFGIIWDFGN